tara:strand:- start:243 stop:1463 length:1221 start_codon:yes stop_codon:yes gene_type:complete
MRNIFNKININETVLYLGYNNETLKNIKSHFPLRNIIIKSTNKIKIKNIIIDEDITIDLVKLKNFYFSNNVKLYISIKNTSIYSVKNFFKNILGYKADIKINENELYTYITLTRPITTILYISDIQNKYTEKVIKNIQKHCIDKRYNFSSYIDTKYSSRCERFKLIKKEIIQTEYLLVLFKYSMILNNTNTLEKLLNTYHITDNIALCFDNNIKHKMNNLFIRNCPHTTDVLDELMISIKNNNDSNYIRNSPYILETSLNIFNNYKTLISYNAPSEYIVCITNDKEETTITSTEELYSENFKTIFNYYIHLSEHFDDITAYTRIYSRKYSWGNTKGYIYGLLEFMYDNKVRNIIESGTYKKITKNIYTVSVANYELMIFFDFKLDSFKGYDLNTLEEVMGFEITDE